MHVLVTGGAGYIGSHIVKALKAASHSTTVFDSLEKSRKENILAIIPKAELVVGSTLSTDDLTHLFQAHAVDAIIHCAAYLDVGESVREPERYFHNNVEGTKRLLEVAAMFKIKYFIFSSTAAVYGNSDLIPIPETAKKEPTSPYGESKLQAEQAIEHSTASGALKATSLRYFNAAGADPENLIGECHEPETHIIPNLLKVASGKSDFCDIFGDDYPTADGTTIRDYIHVTDLAEAHILALGALENREVPYAAYNIGTNHGYSVKEIIEVCRRVTNHPIPVKMRDRRSGDPAVLVADATKIAQELKWQPKYSDLETIIKTAWQWRQKRQ